MIKVKFRVNICDGYLYAAGQDVGIHICDKTWNELITDINETVELYYGLPPKTEFKLTLEMRMRTSGQVEKGDVVAGYPRKGGRDQAR